MIDQIIFYWVGNNLKVPSFLVKSLRIIFKNNIKITQISDEITNKIEGIDEIKRYQSTNKLMTDRIYGYSKIDTINNNTLFLDADTLCLNKINFDQYETGIYLLERESNPMINHQYPQLYPEFEKKYFKEVMPFLAGVVLIKQTNNFFIDAYNKIIELPIRFQEWYGDQYIIKQMYDETPDKFKLLNKDFIYMLEFDGKNKNIQLNLKKQNKLLTFKGSSKKLIEPIYNFLTKHNNSNEN